MLRLFKLLILLIALFFLTNESFSDEPLLVKINKTEVKTGEIITYTVEVKGNFVRPQLTLPEFKQFKITSRNQSKNYRFAGSKTEVIFVMTYQILALSAGSFKIEGAKLSDATGKSFASEPITIKVEGKPYKEREKVLPFIKGGTPI